MDILDKTRFPLLADTLEQTLVYYHLRMQVEKELVDIFDLHVDDMTMLNQIIQLAFKCPATDPNYERMREFRVCSQAERLYLMNLITLRAGSIFFSQLLILRNQLFKKRQKKLKQSR